MPIGMIVYDDFTAPTFENLAADGRPFGREQDIAEVPSFIRPGGIRNMVCPRADVLHTAAHHYSPARARFQVFTPFREFVSGPLHSGAVKEWALASAFGG